MKNLPILLTMFLSILIAQPGVNEIPNTMSFQGLLQSTDGNIYEDGQYDVTFRIFQSFEDSELMIYEQGYNVMVSNGTFAVLLDNLPYGIRMDAEMEIQVGEEVLSPRQSITSVPFAFSSHLALNANQAEEADTSVVSHHAQYSAHAEHAMNADHSIYSDTASVASAIIGGIETVEHANHADTAGFSFSALHSDSSIIASQSNHSMHADTAQFSLQSENALYAINADMANHSTYSDTANYAMGIVGGIDIQDVEHATYADTANYALNIAGGINVDDVQHATYSDTAQFSIQSENAINASTANEAAFSNFAINADTAQYVDQAQSALTANEANIANNSTYADTALYVQQAQSALTAITSQNSTNATYADTTAFVDLSQHSQNISITKNDDAQITLFSTGDGSSSYITLVAQENDGDQTELRVINEGNSNELQIYDATNQNTLMTVGNDGKVTAVSFVGDGSGLTGISSVGSLSDLGLTATATELNYVDGVTSNLQEQLDTKVGITEAQASAIEANSAKVGYTDALVSANTDVATNTAKVGITTTQASAIEANTAKVGYTDALVSANTDVATNTAKVGITTTQASAIEANTAKIGLTNDQSTLLSGITATSNELNIMDGVTATATELNYVDGVTSAIQTQLNAKQAADDDLTDLADGTLSASKVENNEYFISSAGSSGQVWTSDGSGAGAWAAASTSLSGSGSTIDTETLTSSRAIISNSDGNIDISDVTTTELGYLDGVTSAIQTQLNAKGTVSALSDLNITSTATELNVLDGVTATTAELNYTDGVTSAIQTQLDSKQASDADLTDLADGTLSASKVENNEYFITSAGSSGQIWTSDGSGAGGWAASSGATNVTGLSDALVEDNSIYIGNDPSSTTSTAQYNVSLGSTSLDAITTGDANVSIGYNALTANTTGSGNTAYGRSSLSSNTGGEWNVAQGSWSLRDNTTGDDNVAVGNSSLRNNTVGSQNTGVGKSSGFHIESGDNNTTLGYAAGSTGTNNITTGNKNTLLGASTAASASAGTNQIVIGYGASGKGNNTVTIGNGDITVWSASDDGEVDLGSSLVEFKDLYVDGVAYVDAIDLDGTTVSATAAELNYVGGVTSAIQTQLDAKQTADDDLTDLADGTLSASKVENNEYFISSAGSSGQIWTSDGSGAGAWAASTTDALSDAKSGGSNFSNSLILGHQTTGTLNSAEYNVGVGFGSLQAISQGDELVAAGYNSLYSNTTGSRNSAIGNESLYSNTTGNYNAGLGYRSLYANTTGNFNTAVGNSTLGSNTTGRENSGFGHKALLSNTTGENNVAVGRRTLYTTTTSYYNSAVGAYALEDANRTSDTNGYNVAFGYNAGNTGTNDITTGNKNTLLGANTSASAAAGTNQMVIGYGASGHGDNIAVVGNSDLTAIHPGGDNGVDLGSSSYSFKDAYIEGTANIGVLNMSVANTITSSTTYNGNETIIPLNGANLDITIDTDQLVKGRVLTFKNLINQSYTISTEGSEQIQSNNSQMNFNDNLQVNVTGQTITLFSDGSNWYPLGS